MKKFSVVLSLLVAVHSGYARGALVEIPFRLLENRIYIQLRVNGVDSVTFCFDTGASVTVIDSRLENKLGLTTAVSTNKVMDGNGGDVVPRLFNDQAIALGDRELRLPVYTVPFDNMRRKYNPDLDGLIGADIHKQFVVQIDYAKSVIRLYKNIGQVEDRKGYFSVPLVKKAWGIFLVNLHLTVRSREFQGLYMHDTGAANTRLNTTVRSIVHALLGDSTTYYTTVMYGVSQQKSCQEVCRSEELRLAESHFSGFPVTLKNDDPLYGELGELGNDLLKRFDQIIDFRKEVLYIRPNENYNADFGINKCGFEVIWSPDFRFLVVDHITRSRVRPFVQEGDTLEQINGQPVDRADIMQVRSLLNQPGDSVSILLRRDSLKPVFSYWPVAII